MSEPTQREIPAERVEQFVASLRELQKLPVANLRAAIRKALIAQGEQADLFPPQDAL